MTSDSVLEVWAIGLPSYLSKNESDVVASIGWQGNLQRALIRGALSMTTSRDDSLGEGVFYAECDHAGFVRRLVVIAIDFAVLLLIGIALWFVLMGVMWYGFDRDPNAVFWIIWPLTVWVYLAIVKPSSLRTVGYRLTDLKIVDLKGERPSILRMTFRMLLWLLGPFHLLLDLMWLGADSEQQSLRDCYAATCVVRNQAKPIGEGPIHLAYYTAMGLTLMYPRVVRHQQPNDDTT